MAQVFSGKLSGRTAASVDGTATGIIATLTVSLDGDGWLRWTDAGGNARSVQVAGPVAELLSILLTGVGGAGVSFFK